MSGRPINRTLRDSFEEMADTFRTWVESRAAARLETSTRSVTR